MRGWLCYSTSWLSKGSKVVKTRIDNFNENSNTKVRLYGKCDPVDTVVERAIKALGKEKYCLFTNNCEHFAFYCKTGIKKSEQIKNTKATAAGTVAQGVGVITAKKGVELAGKTAIKSLNPISKSLVKVGLKQTPKVAGKVGAGIAGAGGIVTGLATDYVIGQLLEDDEHLTKNERKARKIGRTSGTVGTTVGAISGTVLGAAVGGTGAIVAGALAALLL